MDRKRQLITALLTVGTLTSAAACSDPSAGQDASGNTTITVALAANPQMKTAESLISDFEKKNPGIKVKFTTLPENDLRPAVTKDVATKAGQYDVAMIGSYEVPIWAKNGWIVPLSDYVAKDTAWDEGDVLKPIKQIVSADGKLYAAPFYGSSSFLFYRKDLAKKAGVTIPEKPTWDQVAAAAAKMDDKSAGVSGICLRGLPGWGQNLASLTTVINTFGGRWFDENWKPQLTSAATEKAVKFYVDLLRSHGQQDAAKDGWEGCLQQITQGKTAMWYDDTVFAGSALQEATSQVKNNLGFALAPVEKTDASGWLWSWGLGITASSKHKDAAWKFISWATSKEYIKLAGAKAGWDSVPPGSRTSTYALPGYQKAAQSYADLTLKSINAANPEQPTVDKVPYTGVQYVQIPEFTDIGDYVSQQVAGAISGEQTVEQALQKSQTYTENVVKKAGYLK
ncbi:sugar ABC transporter substrate-binding protein [Streptomyces sp. NPDC091215]|uniref:ABC transporter substrate-binding protein n=1 Tax=Streptomyces sp. NPDC091215 TaxID=3155192 RepID=UPI00341891C5